MSDLTVTAAQVAVVYPAHAEIYPMEAAETITAGQALYIDTNGKAALADGNGSGTLQFIGIALNGGGAGQAIDVLVRGAVYGFTLTGVAYGAPAYMSNTAGALADSGSFIAGRVIPINNTGTLTKVLYVQSAFNTVNA